ncbi:MAG: alpha/beta hydrolase [Ktedonobacteraceae bacterium]|nr:alpha/beta hydrolase [Ktedonobacteraceae bacterium]MBO0795442.1 alpha/beta hydrolase [Ktedonobacteraceae bacterium]
MQTRQHVFYSDGIRLEGLLQLPDSYQAGQRLPGIILASGFQGLKELIPAKLWGAFTSAGLACFTFDYRGFGTSDGEHGRVLPQEQVKDVLDALTFLQQQPEIDPAHIGLLGWGLGGGVVVQAAAEDTRVQAVASLNGVGDAGRAVRDSRPYVDWLALQDRIAQDRIQRVLTGRSQLVSPWEVVPLEPATRANVEEDMYGNHERFGVNISLQSAEAYYAFRPEQVVHCISPRPLLIVHGVQNALHPIDEARSLYALAKEPKDLIEVSGGHHLDWIQPESHLYTTVIPQIIHWFQQHLRAEAVQKVTL